MSGFICRKRSHSDNVPMSPQSPTHSVYTEASTPAPMSVASSHDISDVQDEALGHATGPQGPWASTGQTDDDGDTRAKRVCKDRKIKITERLISISYMATHESFC